MRSESSVHEKKTHLGTASYFPHVTNRADTGFGCTLAPMLPVEPSPEPASAPAAPTGSIKDELGPAAEPQSEPTDATTVKTAGDAAAAGEYEPL